MIDECLCVGESASCYSCRAKEVSLYRATMAKEYGVLLKTRLTRMFSIPELIWDLPEDTLVFAQSFSEDLWAWEKGIELDSDKGLDQKHDTAQILELYYCTPGVQSDFTWFEVHSLWVSEFSKRPGTSRYSWYLKPAAIRSAYPDFTRDAHIAALKKSGDVVERLLKWKAFYEAYLKDPEDVLRLF